MKVADLIEQLRLKVFSGQAGINREVTGGYVSDLLSDVMGNAAEGEVRITLQTHQNVLAIAALKEVAAVILVKGREPEPEMLVHSNEEGVPVLGTDLETFACAGKLYLLLDAARKEA